METLTPIDMKFEDFHRDNPLVYDLFKRFALRAIRSGYEHFSAKTIIERIRWETNIETSDPDFKINNNYTSRYSRLFQKDFPRYSGFFRDRELVSRTRGSARDTEYSARTRRGARMEKLEKAQ